MRQTRRLSAVVLAMIIAVSGTGLAKAQQTDTVTVTLGGGVISFSIDVAPGVETLAYSHVSGGYGSGQIAAFGIAVSDDRNTGAGYSINLAASNFTRSVGGGSIVIGGGSNATLAVSTAGTVVQTGGNPTLPGPTARTVTNVNGTGKSILSALAGEGNGAYNVNGYALSLSQVPATVPGGDYTSTLTLSTSNAAP